MDQQSTEVKIQKIEPWDEAISGPNPYILPTKGGFTYWDCNWKCMQCRVFFNHLDKHWHDFHSDNGPKKQSVCL